MVRKKYDLIRDMLRREKMYYARQQLQLEGVLKQQNKELGLLIFINNNINIILLALLEKDHTEAVEFRDGLRRECKDWEKMFASLQKERLAELNDTNRALKEKQDLYAGFDSYLLRSGGSRGLTSSTSTISMEFDKVWRQMKLRLRDKLIDSSRAVPVPTSRWGTMLSCSSR